MRMRKTINSYLLYKNGSYKKKFPLVIKENTKRCAKRIKVI